MVKVFDVIGNNHLRRSGDREFNEMIIAFIREIGTPKIIDFYPFANREKCFQE